jgi:L-methionine (R)-S-oxide reductase
MFEINSKNLNYENSEKFWHELNSEIQGMMVKEIIPNLANIAAAIYHQMPNLNWCGFYLFDGKQLVLGPFQGKTACIYIPLNKGVCGKAATDLKTVIVDDVEKFPGHIACDAASKSEIVIPVLTADGNLFAVFDLDSPMINRFSRTDALGLESIVKTLQKNLPK